MITQIEYSTLDNAYKFFNERLFGHNLPEVLITFQRKPKANGYFHFECICDRDNPDKRISEIALNIENFQDRSDQDILSTLCHEMAHAWQFYLGTRPERRNYHDREFSEMMEKIGLMTSSTGEKGGKRCAVKMSHYIISGGKFEKYCNEFLQNNKINWQNVRISENTKQTRNRKSKLKYQCPDCQEFAWTKVEKKLICGECDREMEEQIL